MKNILTRMSSMTIISFLATTALVLAAVPVRAQEALSTDLNRGLIPPVSVLMAGVIPADSPLAYANVSWPSKEVIDQKQIKDKDEHKSEIQRTWRWFEIVVANDYLPPTQDQLLLLPKMVRGDDWILTSYTAKDVSIQIIDGRAMTVVVKPVHPQQFQSLKITARRRIPKRNDTAEAQEDKASAPAGLEVNNVQAGVATFVHALFRSCFNYDRYLSTEKVVTAIVDVKQAGAGSYYGRITVARDQRWLEEGSIVWWSDGKVAVFESQKRVAPSKNTKAPVYASADWYIGGIPYNDERRFARFDPAEAINFKAELKKHYYSPKT